jgi:plasmid maintenance system antidote protein VapI
MPTDTNQIDPVAVTAKAVMAERGISAEWLAKKLEMKNRTVLDFINQRRGTRKSTRLSICRELGIDHEQVQASA